MLFISSVFMVSLFSDPNADPNGSGYPECGMIEFSTFSSGFGSETVYEGFYYSDEDVPFGFQGTSMSFQSDGGGWSWHESDGDNFEYTENILGKWYWYRMHF